MISKETYLKMKELIAEYDGPRKVESKEEEPYIKGEIILETSGSKYNPKYGDNRVCKCGHSYYRHFDTYEGMEPIGCKYCQCYEFKEETDDCMCKESAMQAMKDGKKVSHPLFFDDQYLYMKDGILHDENDIEWGDEKCSTWTKLRGGYEYKTKWFIKK